MSWVTERARLLGTAPALTLDDVFAALRDRDAQVRIEDGVLRIEPPVPTDDPLAAGLFEHRALLIEMFTYAPDGRCVFTDCYRLRGDGDQLACPDHRATIDALVMLWDEAS